MAEPKLHEWEVSLIKGMLARGMPNRNIQFFFNTPDRPVNSGRISEIKGEARWADVPAASQYEVDEFIDHHPQRGIVAPAGEPEPPRQQAAAALFTVSDELRIELIPEPPGGDSPSPELEELYVELRVKADAVLDIGHNNLGTVKTPVQRFAEAVEGPIVDARSLTIWLRGNALRALLAAHDKEGDALHPAKLDALCAEKLRDLVETFNLFAAHDWKSARFDAQRLGPEDRTAALAALVELEPVVADAGNVASGDAASTLQEQAAAAEEAPAGPTGDRTVAVAKDTASNFVLATILGVYRAVRRAAYDEVARAWRTIADTAYKTIGTTLGVGIAGSLGVFLLKHLAAIRSYADQMIANPAVQRILDLLQGLL